MFKGIVFDFDGLIIDTETPQYEAFNEVFKRYNEKLPIELWLNEVGTNSDFDSMAFLEEKLNIKLDKNKLKKEVKQNIMKSIELQTLRLDVIKYLETAGQLGFKTGLASSSSYKWVNSFLRKFDIYDYFDSIKTSDDVKNVKPDPELYLRVAEEMQLNPEQCLVFEDSPNGLAAAKSAGMFCVVVPNKLTSHAKFKNYDYKIHSMAELSLQELMKIIREEKSKNEWIVQEK